MAPDIVQPTSQQLKRVQSDSRRIWSSHANEANQQTITDTSFCIRDNLGPAPVFPEGWLCSCHLNHPQAEVLGSSLYIQGHACWNSSTRDCRQNYKEISQTILVGVPGPSHITLQEGTHFEDWPGTTVQNGNYLAVFTFAWAYIFSARWVEMCSHRGISGQYGHASIFYSDNALVTPDYLELGRVSRDAHRWWKALLVAGGGWNATVNFKGSIYHSPWSAYTIPVGGAAFAKDCGVTAPDSKSSTRYLIELCDHMGCYDQCLAALAIVILLPTSRHLTLPKPKPCTPRRSRSFMGNRCSIAAEAALIPYYMTLSGNTRGVMALLCGAFYDPSIDCRFVSAWLQPAFDVVDSCVHSQNPVHLSNIMSARQPKLAWLWLGAIIIGLHLPAIQRSRYGTPLINLQAAAWTQTCHTFIQSGPTPSERENIARADECRLLFMLGAEGHCHTPICPWKPFGFVPIEHAAIETRLHYQCDHNFNYAGWRWKGKTNIDPGYRRPFWSLARSAVPWLRQALGGPSSRGMEREADKPLASLIASETATRSIFLWYRSDGWPQGEEFIWTHPWLEVDDDDESEVSDGQSGGQDLESRTAGTSRVTHWISPQ
ncbi:hypothetical protein EG327_010775 [Venturia inaequalis]|uniref:Uncharacterized protein n=1 Tax=Venturia inaequalis TaxID=5025 RepID=A0A8H3YQ58_VENIN|nr:hypothetical protein EG327_010775 [Venturia inaequalis]